MIRFIDVPKSLIAEMVIDAPEQIVALSIPQRRFLIASIVLHAGLNTVSIIIQILSFVKGNVLAVPSFTSAHVRVVAKTSSGFSQEMDADSILNNFAPEIPLQNLMVRHGEIALLPARLKGPVLLKGPNRLKGPVSLKEPILLKGPVSLKEPILLKGPDSLKEPILSMGLDLSFPRMMVRLRRLYNVDERLIANRLVDLLMKVDHILVLVLWKHDYGEFPTREVDEVDENHLPHSN